MSGHKEEKLVRLKNILADMGGAVIAFSGGVDSTFLVKTAKDVLGERILAVTSNSEIHPTGEPEEAVKLAKDMGVPHMVIEGSELEIEGLAENTPDRCYICKRALFIRLLNIAKERGLPYVIDGSNVDDAGDYRPGARAALELGIRSPLKEAGLTKEDIRNLSREQDLPTWNKPSMACLSSRFPYGTEITPERLAQVREAEEALRKLGFGQLRVRYHREIARIEVVPEDIPKAISLASQIADHLKKLGFVYVTLDLEGFRSGSMNDLLK